MDPQVIRHRTPGYVKLISIGLALYYERNRLIFFLILFDGFGENGLQNSCVGRADNDPTAELRLFVFSIMLTEIEHEFEGIVTDFKIIGVFSFGFFTLLERYQRGTICASIGFSKGYHPIASGIRSHLAQQKGYQIAQVGRGLT